MISFNLEGIHIIMIFISLDILSKDILGTPPLFLFGVDGRDPVSRLAFRVQCCRNDNKELKIAAAGFDFANELFLGPYALRWGTQAEGGPIGGVDGGITVGLYLWKPAPQADTDTCAGEWYEVSALGELYHLRVAGARGRKAVDVDNTLTDGWCLPPPLCKI